MVRRFVLWAVACLGCVSGVATADPAPIIATYKSEQRLADGGETTSPKTVDWRFERGLGYVAIGDLEHKRAERWQKDAQGRIWYWRVFHAERKIIEYQPVDLSMSGISGSWSQITSVIDPRVLQSLNRTSETKAVLGRQATIYRGSQNGTDVEVWWLPDEEIPAYIRRQGKRGGSSLKLVGLDQLDPARAEFARSVLELPGYESIDFADIGDRHSDPLVESLMKHEGTWFGHGH